MAEQIRRLAAVLSATFLVLALALGYWQILRASEVLERPSNPRVIEEERRLLRGRLLDRNGEVLASSARVGDLAHRSYSYPPLAHVTGYVSPRYGRTGLEAALDPYLRGQRPADPLFGLVTRLLRRSPQGADVTLTIDLRLQREADRVLGAGRGAVVVLHAGTGEILALASHPYFDANTIDVSWQRLLEDPDRPLVHRALQGQYVPGSVFKLITAAAALDLGIVEPGHRHHHEADLIVQGFRIRNSNHPALTDLSFAEEFAWSCNVAFALTGLSLGSGGPIDFGLLSPRGAAVWPPGDVRASGQRLVEYAHRFLIGEEVGLELPSASGRIPSEMTPVELASTAFGQGNLQVTPLQMALAAATIANGGTMPAPHLVAAVRDPWGGSGIPRPTAPRMVIRPATAQALNAMMVLSVDTAYAQPARIPGVFVGGKTGTAEVGEDGTPHSWFVGYAPADRPGVAIAVVVENRGSGSQVAAPAARQVLEAALRLGY